METKINTTKPELNRLTSFRQAIYKCFTRAADALFELLDALLCSPGLLSFPELSCAPVFRRQWPSVYEALQDGQLDRDQLLKHCVEILPANPRPLLVGDHTAWGRPQARTLNDRTFEHQPTPIKGQKPITIGHGYSTLGVVPEAEGSWFVPLLHERVKSDTTPRAHAADQLKRVCPLLGVRPVALYDSEYGSGTFLTHTQDIACDLLFRIRPNRTLRRVPGPYSGRGRPSLHGAVFRLSDPTTWGSPNTSWEGEDAQLSPVRVECWYALHFEDAPKRLLDVFRIQRLNARGTRHDPSVVGLGWCGQAPLEIPTGWCDYLRRYVIEHGYRFANPSLRWKLPQLSTPAQGEVWAALIPVATLQLYLARQTVQDQPRPWPKALPVLTPGRTHQAMGGVLAGIGTPAAPPKPRGKSSGWPSGRIRSKRTRYPVIKKTVAKAKKQASPTEHASP
jgi:hypothetical protein